MWRGMSLITRVLKDYCIFSYFTYILFKEWMANMRPQARKYLGNTSGMWKVPEH